MKKTDLKSLILRKVVISTFSLYGGVTDPDEDEDFEIDRPNQPSPSLTLNPTPRSPNPVPNPNPDHTRSCPSWNVSC